MEYKRETHVPTDLENLKEPVMNIFTFRTQNLLDLYRNEISGQISDGMWENSRNTEWIWGVKCAYVLGDKTSMKTYKSVGKKNFFITKELCDIIGERARVEAGFDTIEDMKKGWNEIAQAIRTAQQFTYEDVDKYVTQPRITQQTLKEQTTKNLSEQLVQELGEDNLQHASNGCFYHKGTDFRIEIVPYRFDVDGKCFKISAFESYLSGLTKCIKLQDIKHYIDFLKEVKERYDAF